MMDHQRIAAALLLGFGGAICAHPALAQPAAPFAGKTVEILVGHEVGGGYDLYSRVLAHHMTRHIAGEPSMVVKNMPGAGGLRMASYLVNGAAKDGTSFGLFDRGGVIEPLLGNPGARFDGSKLTTIGSIGKQVATCAAYYTAPVQTIQQAQQQELLVGATGPSATSTYPALLNAVLKTKFKPITGYKGSAAIMFAMEQGEVHGVCLSWPTLKAADATPTKGAGVTGDLSVVTRDDGTKQIAYKGLPLYFFQADQAVGDAKGAAIANWAVALP